MAIQHEVSSGNVFTDIGVSEPTETLAKAELAHRISSIIRHRYLKQTDAVNFLKLINSKLVRGQLKDFSIEKLMSFLMQLDRDIEIVIEKTSDV